MREQRRSQCSSRSARALPGAQLGYSLPEMLAVVAIIGIIALAAVPAFGSFVRSYKARSAADEMLAALRGARQMAISMRQNITVTFTPGSPGSYSYFHPIRGQNVTVQLPDWITTTTNPTGSFAPEFRPNGSIVPSSTPSMTNPTANFVRMAAVINNSRTDTYTYGFSAAGQVTYRVTR